MWADEQYSISTVAFDVDTQPVGAVMVEGDAVSESCQKLRRSLSALDEQLCEWLHGDGIPKYDANNDIAVNADVEGASLQFDLSEQANDSDIRASQCE